MEEFVYITWAFAGIVIAYIVIVKAKIKNQNK